MPLRLALQARAPAWRPQKKKKKKKMPAEKTAHITRTSLLTLSSCGAVHLLFFGETMSLLRCFLVAAAVVSSLTQSTCSSTTEELPCLSDSSCAWCEGSAGGAPSHCTDNSTAPTDGTCGNGLQTYCSEKANSNATCQTVVGCYWCTSRTVGPICAGYAEQKRLPKSVFTCNGPY